MEKLQKAMTSDAIKKHFGKTAKATLLLCLLLISGCASSRDFHVGLDFEILNGSEKTWYSRGDNATTRNAFFVGYGDPSDIDSRINMIIEFAGTFYTWDSSSGYLLIPTSFKGKGDNADLCIGHDNRWIFITFFNNNLEFDTGRVYVLKYGQKIFGQDVTSPHMDSGLYNLTDHEVASKRPDRDFPTQYRITHFKFGFQLSCADYEDAIFVMDGLYQNGKKLPPLKIRLKYKDFDKVPKNTLLGG